MKVKNIANLVLSLLVLLSANSAVAGSKEYHDCMDAGGYQQDCKHHLSGD